MKKNDQQGKVGGQEESKGEGSVTRQHFAHVWWAEGRVGNHRVVQKMVPVCGCGVQRGGGEYNITSEGEMQERECVSVCVCDR